jgi:hypothetical protein
MKILRHLLKGIVLLAALLAVASFAAVFYMPYHSSKVAHAFCDSVHANDELADLDSRARGAHIHHTKSARTDEHEFWVPGIFETMSTCYVAFTNGKVVSKHVDDN